MLTTRRIYTIDHALRPRPLSGKRFALLVGGALCIGIGFFITLLIIATQLSSKNLESLMSQLPNVSIPHIPIGDKPNNTSDNPLWGRKLYVSPESNASQQANAWRTTRPAQAVQMDKLAALPAAYWVGDWTDFTELKDYLRAAKQNNSLPVIVVYNIPNRDCGGYSAGGAKNQAAYANFIDQTSKAIDNVPTAIILEPDAIAQLPCFNANQQQIQINMLKSAVAKLKSSPDRYVYIDAGNSVWSKDTQDIADKLTKAGINQADGFSLNVSNFQTNADTITYGNAISAFTNDKHFVIDTSRNGLGPFKEATTEEGVWCNPPGRALGHYPTTDTKHKTVDAFLYIKGIGESDGQDPDPAKCWGGPKAGVWWPEYALGLLERWPTDLQP